MRYLDIDPKKFADFYDLDLDPIRCPKCGFMQPLVRPFEYISVIEGLMVGLEAKVHDCGPGLCAFRSVAADPKKRAEWSYVFDALEERRVK